MKQLRIREFEGRYDLENFGPALTGPDGRKTFTLVIESQERGLYFEFPEATVFDLFTRFDLADPAFRAGAFRCPDFLRIAVGQGECEVEVRTGSLYDFFRERLAEGRCLVRVHHPLRLTWAGDRADVA